MVKTGSDSVHKVYTQENGVTVVGEKPFEVRICQRKNNLELYSISYRHGGKQGQKTRKGLDRAIEKAKEICASLKSGIPAAVQLNAHDIQTFILCRRKLRSINGPDLEVAIHEYCGALEVLPEGVGLLEAVRFYNSKARNILPAKVQEAVSEYLQERKNDLSELYWNQERYRLTRFSEAFQCDVDSISKPALRLFISETLNDVSATTRNHFKNSIKAFLSWCVRRDYLNPDHRLTEELISQRTNQRPPDPYSAAELETILSKADGALRDTLAVMAFTGCRHSEGLRMTWEGVYSKWDEGLIELEQDKTKTSARRLVPFHEALKSFLGDSQGNRTGLIWPQAPRYFSKVRLNFLRKIGITPRDNGFRDGYISARTSITKNVNEVALECGNSAQMIFRNYRHVLSPTEAEKWFSIRKSNH